MSIGIQTSPILLKKKVNIADVSSIANRTNRASEEKPIGPVTRMALKRSTYLETNKKDEHPTRVNQNRAYNFATAVEPGTGKFPCLVDGCNELLPHDLMLSHVEEEHPQLLANVIFIFCYFFLLANVFIHSQDSFFFVGCCRERKCLYQ